MNPSNNPSRYVKAFGAITVVSGWDWDHDLAIVMMHCDECKQDIVDVTGLNMDKLSQTMLNHWAIHVGDSN